MCRWFLFALIIIKDPVVVVAIVKADLCLVKLCAEIVRIIELFLCSLSVLRKLKFGFGGQSVSILYIALVFYQDRLNCIMK